MNLNKRFRSLWDNPGPDKGWSWVVMIAIWMAYFIVMSPVRSSGVFYNTMMLSMDATPEEASWPFSLCNAVSGFSGIVGGYLNEHFSCRQANMISAFLGTLSFVLCYALPLNIFWITASYGILFGLAHGISLPILQMVQNDYFESYRTSSSGISLTGVSAVGVIGPLMAKYTIERYDIRGCFLILASLVCQMFIFSCLMRPRTQKSFPIHEFRNIGKLISEELHHEMVVTASPPDDAEKAKSNILNTILPETLTTLMKQPAFVLMCFTSSMVHVSYFTFLSFAIAHGCSVGFALSSATLLVSVYSVGELISRFAIGFFVDKRIFSPTLAFSVVVTVAGVSIVIFGLSSNLLVSFTSVFVFGFAAGCYIPLRGTLMATLFGVRYTAFGIGVIHATCGILFLFIPKLIGLLTKQERSFEYVCYVLGCACALGGFVWTLQMATTCKKTPSIINTQTTS